MVPNLTALLSAHRPPEASFRGPSQLLGDAVEARAFRYLGDVIHRGTPAILHLALNGLVDVRNADGKEYGRGRRALRGFRHYAHGLAVLTAQLLPVQEFGLRWLWAVSS